jgi:hypothetical protein
VFRTAASERAETATLESLAFFAAKAVPTSVGGGGVLVMRVCRPFRWSHRVGGGGKGFIERPSGVLDEIRK